ncbi:MAG: pitrilysin family protein [Thermaerobacter sp.]|nr:pitrilysin family protein [Thermaerobacter sp.]
MAKLEAFERPELGEKSYRHRLESGLDVVVIPRPGFKKTFATFATRYGSIDNHFRVPGSDLEMKVPDGIAHFLEHKMFEKQDGGDVFDDFARLGASSNAYTDYTSTTFLFSTTSEVSANLEVLLDFVQRPYFTEDNVEKEKGIIEQEIRMYLDMPGDRLHSNLMRALYHYHPARIDIAGTVESIRAITPDDLYRCHNTFYHPGNMLVLVIGDVDPQAVADQVVHNQQNKQFLRQGDIVRIYPPEPEVVKERRVEQPMPVAAPLFMMGYKDHAAGMTGPAWLRHEIVLGLMWSMLLGRSSALFTDLYQAGLINDRFSARYSGTDTFGFSNLGGETPDPKRLEAVLTERLAQEPLTEEALERLKKREMGDFLGLFQNPEDLAYAFNHFYFRGIDLYSYVDVVASVRLRDIEEARARHLVEDSRALSLIVPAQSAPGA